MKKFTSYSNEELISLGKRQPVYYCLLYYRNWKKANPNRVYLEDYETKCTALYEADNLLGQDKYGIYSVNHELHNHEYLREKNLLLKVENMKQYGADEEETSVYNNEIDFHHYMQNSIVWETNLYEYNADIEGMTPEEYRDEFLNCTDYDNILYKKATDHEMYDFLWNCMRYMTLVEINKLIKMYETGLETKWAIQPVKKGRPSSDIKIMMIECGEWKLEHVFKSRKDAIEVTGIKKNLLSMCIKSSKDYPEMKSMWRKFTWNNKKYVFLEQKQ